MAENGTKSITFPATNIAGEAKRRIFMTIIPLENIIPNPDQPRKNFDPSELQSLAQSIKENGLLQPILVEKLSDDMYILCDGERRTRAAKIAGLAEIPAMIISSQNGDGSQLRLIRALIANLQRQNLNPLEEARTYRRLLDEQNMTIRQLSIKTGLAEYRINNALLILKLDEPIQKLIENGKFTHLPSCINQIMEIPEKSARIELCQKLAARGLGKNGKAIKNSTHLLIKKIKGSISFQDDEIPSLELAQNKIQVEKPKWDILYQAGKVPSWTAVYKSAMETCNTCSRRPLASEVTCKNCLAAALLSRLIEAANREKARSMAEKVVRKRAIANGIR